MSGSDPLRFEQFIEFVWPLAAQGGEHEALHRLCHAATVLLAQDGVAVGVFDTAGGYKLVSCFGLSPEPRNVESDAAFLDTLGRVADATDPFRVVETGAHPVLLAPIRGGRRGCVHLVRREGSFPPDVLTAARFLGAVAGLLLGTARRPPWIPSANVIADVAHDLRAPLNVLIGYAALLREEAFGPLTGEQRDATATVELEAQRLLDLLTGVLDLVRLDLEDLVRNTGPTALHAVVRDVATAAPQRGRPPPLVELDAPDCLPPVHADPHVLRLALKQILVYLASLSERPPSGVWSAHRDRMRRTVVIRIPCAPGPSPRSAPLTLADAFLRTVGGELEIAREQLLVHLPAHGE